MSAQLLSTRSSRCCAARQAAARRPAFSPQVNAPQRLVYARAPVRVSAAQTEGPKYAEEVTDATFDEKVLKEQSVPVLVDFWAPWCGPCRIISNVIDELAVKYKDKLKCVKLNTDVSPGIATQYSIRSIPTVMIFKNGAKMESVIGAVPPKTLEVTIEKYLTNP